MSNLLTNIFSKDDVQSLAAQAEKLVNKQAALSKQLQAEETIRRQNAVAAAEGDEQATAALERANAEAAKLRAKLDDLGLAVKEANRRVNAARDGATQDERQAKVRALQGFCKKRLAAAEDAENAMRTLAKALELMEDAGVEIDALHLELVPGDQGRRFVRVFERETVANRIAQFAAGIGLATPMSGDVNTMAPKPPSFVEAEAEAQRFYEISDTPPEADEAA